MSIKNVFSINERPIEGAVVSLRRNAIVLAIKRTNHLGEYSFDERYFIDDAIEDVETASDYDVVIRYGVEKYTRKLNVITDDENTSSDSVDDKEKQPEPASSPITTTTTQAAPDTTLVIPKVPVTTMTTVSSPTIIEPVASGKTEEKSTELKTEAKVETKTATPSK